MCATIAAVGVSQNSEAITQEVTCIFCGLQTPIPASSAGKFASHLPRHLAIVRCEVCGKEAPYRTCDFLDLGEMCRSRGF